MRGRRDRTLTGLDRDDRGISETVGFVLTFGVIITSVGLVSTVGLSELNRFQENQQLQNAERTFELIARSFDEIEESQTIARTDAIDLNQGSLSVGASSSVEIDVPSGSIPTFSLPLNSLEYLSKNTRISYENGATFRTKVDQDAGIIQHEPGYICTDDVAVLSFVTLQRDSLRQIGGEGTLRISGQQTNTTLLYPTGGANAATPDHVDFTITSERAREWRQHFERSDGNWVIRSSSDSTVEVRCGGSGNPVDRVYVRSTVIDVTFSD